MRDPLFFLHSYFVMFGTNINTIRTWWWRDDIIVCILLLFFLYQKKKWCFQRFQLLLFHICRSKPFYTHETHQRNEMKEEKWCLATVNKWMKWNEMLSSYPNSKKEKNLAFFFFLFFYFLLIHIICQTWMNEKKKIGIWCNCGEKKREGFRSGKEKKDHKVRIFSIFFKIESPGKKFLYDEWMNEMKW